MLQEVVALARRAEALFGRPQDVEWTFRDGRLYTLQSRPVTTGRHEEDPAVGSGAEPRGWYLSLTRSFENLKALRRQIEEVSIPALLADAASFAAVDLAALTAEGLIEEIGRRTAVRDHWTGVYSEEFIPFAHGMRLFGQVYNDVVRPEDPYEFLDLLAGGGLLSVERNGLLDRLAEELRAAGEVGDPDLDGFLDRFGSGTRGAAGRAPARARRPAAPAGAAGRPRPPRRRRRRPGDPRRRRSNSALEERASSYLARFEGEERNFQEELLDLARASYRLRDDDNLHLDRVEAGLRAALEKGRRRLAASGLDSPQTCPSAR